MDAAHTCGFQDLLKHFSVGKATDWVHPCTHYFGKCATNRLYIPYIHMCVCACFCANLDM